MSERPYAFGKRYRLRRRRDFERVFRRKCSVSDSKLILYLDRNEAGVTRLGISVGRKHGPAVRRNRIKRLLREAFRLSRHDLPSGYDLICIPRPGTMASRDEYMDSLHKLTRLATQRLAARNRRQQKRSRPGRHGHRALG